MNMTEIANLIEGLRKIGFSDSQIADFQLMIEGRINLDEWVERYNNAIKDNKAD